MCYFESASQCSLSAAQPTGNVSKHMERMVGKDAKLRLGGDAEWCSTTESCCVYLSPFLKHFFEVAI